MSAKVYSLDAARERPRPAVVTVNFRIEPSGDLTIREVRDDGVKLPAIVIADEHVDGLLTYLAAKRGRLRTERFYAQHPEQQPRPTKQRRPLCKRRRDGGLAVIGGGDDDCRRRAGHAGQCRDAGGDYTPAICLHVGRLRSRVVTSGGTFSRCNHCGAQVPP